MLCPNCGATLTEQDTKCPYCGTPNPAGAEKKYMNQLSDLRKQMEGLEKESHKAYKKEFHRSSRFILRTCLILVGILAAITILFQVSEFISRQKSRADTESKMAFEREYYTIYMPRETMQPLMITTCPCMKRMGPMHFSGGNIIAISMRTIPIMNFSP